MLFISKTCESKQMYIDASSESSLPDSSIMFLYFSSYVNKNKYHPSSEILSKGHSDIIISSVAKETTLNTQAKITMLRKQLATTSRSLIYKATKLNVLLKARRHQSYYQSKQTNIQSNIHSDCNNSKLIKELLLTESLLKQQAWYG